MWEPQLVAAEKKRNRSGRSKGADVRVSIVQRLISTPDLWIGGFWGGGVGGRPSVSLASLVIGGEDFSDDPFHWSISQGLDKYPVRSLGTECCRKLWLYRAHVPLPRSQVTDWLIG